MVSAIFNAILKARYRTLREMHNKCLIVSLLREWVQLGDFIWKQQVDNDDWYQDLSDRHPL